MFTARDRSDKGHWYAILQGVLVLVLSFSISASYGIGDGLRSAPGSDTVNAVVVYGDTSLLDEDEPLSDERLDHLLDSLCQLDEAPLELIGYLKLFKRIRGMEEAEMIVLIDSLFELEHVPYALINEINLYADELPTQNEVDEGLLVDWHGPWEHPGDGYYGEWNTTNPNAYGHTLSAHDSLLLIKLTDPATDCGFAMPIEGIVTSRFGWRNGRPHNGVDIDLEVWDPVQSMFPGVVRFSGVYGGFGRLVVVRHFNGFETFYAHLHRLKVQVGDEVDAGQVIGLGGSSGHSTGSHLHLEVRFKGIPIDPSRFIDLSESTLYADTLVLKRTRWSFAAYPQGTRSHTVQKGEHLYAIAELYGTSIQDLCELNGISKRSVLRVGQQLMVSDMASAGP